MSTEVKVPTLGESVAEATIGEWLKQPGEAVALDEPIASLETDKVAVEVTAPVAGVMGQYLAQVGDNVSVGAVIATIAAIHVLAASARVPPRKKRRRNAMVMGLSSSCCSPVVPSPARSRPACTTSPASPRVGSSASGPRCRSRSAGSPARGSCRTLDRSRTCRTY